MRWIAYLCRTHKPLEHALRVLQACADFLAIDGEHMECAPLLLRSDECVKGTPQYLSKGDDALQLLHEEEGAEAHTECALLKRSVEADAQHACCCTRSCMMRVREFFRYCACEVLLLLSSIWGDLLLRAKFCMRSFAAPCRVARSVHASSAAQVEALRMRAQNRPFPSCTCGHFKLSVLTRNWCIIFCIECLFCHVEVHLLDFAYSSAVLLSFQQLCQGWAWLGHVLFSKIVVERWPYDVDSWLTRATLLIGNDTLSLLRGDNASYLSTDDNSLSLLMGNNASYLLTSDNAMSL